MKLPDQSGFLPNDFRGSVLDLVRTAEGLSCGSQQQENKYAYVCISVVSLSSEFLQDRAEQGGDVHPLHPQAVRPALESAKLHR